ncbi:energy transducer TonB family protein [Ruegeria lacuscaerulensis]|uniref:energy transducer TonB family protein n=1 Tax=Ruegeria lacuscaerulensis TaxID=55218 RepID=UPI00147B8BFE|nr:energy transducer TonB [Ruegeria lacuscaerulensis]
MIRGSVVIAVVAILVSLILHLMGLLYTAPRLAEDGSEAAAQNSVELGSSFEDLAEEAEEAVEPEQAEAPEPPAEEEPVEEEIPETPEVPISEALVASDNPEESFAPDLGEAEVVQPEATEPVEPNVAESVDGTDGDQSASEEADETPPVKVAERAETPEGDPDAAAESTEPLEEAQPVEPAQEQLAALPPTEAAPVPEATAIPVVPLESEAIEPDLPETALEPVENDAPTELAVTTSIRPQRPERQPVPQRRGIANGARDFSNLRFPAQEIESPLTAYRRRGVDAFTSGNSGTRSGGRGPGNANETNYEGQVLVHLNRAPLVFVSARGFAQVFFQINPDGTLEFVEVVDSSGSREVDRAAREQVRAAEPFPRPPGGVSRKLSFFYTSN